MTYRQHGHVPNDDEIAALGYKAFAPARPAFEPTVDDWQRASGDIATGDPDELRATAERLAEMWPPAFGWPGFFWGLDDDDL